MHSKTFIITSLLALVVASPFEKRTVSQIMADLDTMQSRTIGLDNAVLAFSNSDGTFFEALAIRNDAIALDDSVNMATVDVENTGPLSGTDGELILGEVEAIKPLIIKALQDIATTRPRTDELDLTSSVKSGLQTLQRDTRALEDALISNAPSSLLPRATQIASSIDAAFAAAVTAFS